jgi:hypothetical protein
MKTNETADGEVLQLTGKQAGVLAALVAGATIEGAAKAHRIRPATIHAWLKTSAFNDAYSSALRDVIAHAGGQLKAACAVAVATLREVAEDSSAPSAPRVSAARAIIELSQRMIEQEEVLGRIEALEALQQ